MKHVTIKHYNTLIMMPFIGLFAPVYALVEYGNCVVDNAKATPVILGIFIQAISYTAAIYIPIFLSLIK